MDERGARSRFLPILLSVIVIRAEEGMLRSRLRWLTGAFTGTSPVGHPPALRQWTRFSFSHESVRIALHILADHAVQGKPVVPAAAYLEIALSAAKAIGWISPQSIPPPSSSRVFSIRRTLCNAF